MMHMRINEGQGREKASHASKQSLNRLLKDGIAPGQCYDYLAGHMYHLKGANWQTLLR